MDRIWSEPLPTGLWSMFACGYDASSGPIRYNSSAIFWDRFLADWDWINIANPPAASSAFGNIAKQCLDEIFSNRRP